MLKLGEKGAIPQKQENSYTIAPHIPCGFVTPELLRKIADVSEKYDAKALKNIPVNLIAPLRHTLFNGMHLLALISGFLLFIALFVNWLDPWKKGLE